MPKTLREIVRDLDLTTLNDGDGMTFANAIEAATACAAGLNYPVNLGTGGAYADTMVSDEDAAIIADLVVNTDADGVYRAPVLPQRTPADAINDAIGAHARTILSA